MMRPKASQPAPRLPLSRFRAGCRICADSFRRAVPILALVFLASLLALGFRGSNFAQLSLSIALGRSDPPEQAEDRDRGGDDEIRAEVSDGPDAVATAFGSRGSCRM